MLQGGAKLDLLSCAPPRTTLWAVGLARVCFKDLCALRVLSLKGIRTEFGGIIRAPPTYLAFAASPATLATSSAYMHALQSSSGHRITHERSSSRDSTHLLRHDRHWRGGCAQPCLT